MAQNQANFGIGFKVDKSGLNELKKSLQDIIKLGEQSSKSGSIDEGLKQACQTAKQLETILDGAWNSKLGQLNLDKVNQGIKNTYGSVSQLRQQLEASGAAGTAAGNVGQTAYNKMASQILNTNVQLKQTNSLLDNMATSMANTVKWGITSSIFNNMTRSVQDAFYYVKNLDSSLNDIRIVTGASADQMASFAQQANTAAKALGQSTRSYTDASLIYYQQGLSEEDVKARTEVTLKAANVTGQSAQAVSEQLTAVWNGYKVEASEAELYIDKLAAVATTTASDLEELSTGMSKVASAANAMGVDVDQLNAQLATIVSVTRQAPESVGTALKTIYARMSDLKLGGVDEDGMGLGKVTGQMEEMGIKVLDANGDLRDMGAVIEEVATKWDGWTSAQQTAMAQVMAGTRQYNNLVALFDNWDMYTDALNTSVGAVGTLQEQQDIYMERTEAHLKQLKAELETTYSSLLNTDVLNGTVDIIKDMVEQFNSFINGIGGGGNALINFGAIGVNVFSKQLGASINQTIQNIEALKANLSAIKLKDEVSKDILQKIQDQHVANGEGKLDDSALAKEAQYAQKTLQLRQVLTQEQQNYFTSLQSEIGLRERELNYLREYQNIARNILDDENATLEMFQERVQIQQKALKEAREQQTNTTKNIKKYNDADYPDDGDNAILTERLTKLSQITEEEEKQKIINDAIKNIKNGQNITETQTKVILEAETKEVEKQKTLLGQVTQGLKGKQAAEDGTLDALTAEQAAREKILQQQQAQAERQQRITDIIRKTSAVLQGLNAVVGALSKGMDETATAADKADATFAGLSGGLSAVANYIMPGSGILVQGVFDLLRGTMELIGLWDNFENIFKTTADKLAEINEGVTKNNEITKKTNTQIGYIEQVKEEYAELSEKAGQYGEKLDQMTAEEQARYTELTNTFTEYNSAIILGYDRQGRAIVDNQTAIQKTIDMLREQAKLEARENLKDIPGQLNTFNSNVEGAQKEVDDLSAISTTEYDIWSDNADKGFTYDGNNNIIDNAVTESDLIKALGSYNLYLSNLKEEVKNTETAIKDTEDSMKNLTVAELVETTYDLYEEIERQEGRMTEDQFTRLQEYSAELRKFFTEENFIDEIGTDFWNKGDVLTKASELFEAFSEYQEPILKLAEQYQQTTGKIQADLTAANQKLKDAKLFDTNYLLSVIQYGEGYDQEWDALSFEAQQIGSRLVIDYVENLEYGMVAEKATQLNREGEVYQVAVEMIQEFVASFGEAYNLIGESLSEAIENADLSNFEGTSKEYKEKISEIIESVLNGISNEQLQDQGTKDALSAYFKNIFGLNDLDIDFDSGQVQNMSTTVEELYADTAEIISNKLSKFKIDNVDVIGPWLEGILDESELANIDEIMSKFDFAEFKEGPQNLETFGEYLKKAAEAAAEAETSTSKYNKAIENNKNILKKFEDKESLTEAEKEYLSTLEQEFPMLKNLQRGSKEYSEAMKKAQEEQTKNYKKSLEEEKEDLENNLKEKRQALKEYSEEEKEDPNSDYQKDLAEIAADEARVQDIDYEMNVILVAEPSIADQIRNLYNEADTLITLRATVENGEALSEGQQNALGDFFASDQGQPFMEEYLSTGVITDQMLNAVEAFADAKTELAQEAKEGLVAEAEELKTAADRLQKEAEGYLDQGKVELAEKKFAEADAKYAEAGGKVAEIATIDSEEEDYQKNKDDAFDSSVDKFDIEGEETRNLGENLQEAAKDSEVLSENLVDNADAAREVAKEIKRAEKAVESIKDNYKDWSKALEESNEFSEEYGEALEGMRTSFEDFLDLDYDSLSDEFVKSAEAQELLQKAMSGTGEEAQTAYNELQALAAQDIYNENIGNLSEEISNEMQEIAAIESVDVGEKIVVGENEVANKLNNLYSNAVNAAIAGGQSVASAMQTANSIINAVGYEAPEIEMEEKTVTVTGQLPDGWTPQENGSMTGPDGQLLQGVKWIEESGGTYTYTQTMLVPKAKSFTKSSENLGGANTGGGGNGGGGGGGGGGGKKLKKPEKRQKDYYHKVNKNLKKLTTAYERLAEIQDKTFGKDHIENIKKVNENIDQQILKLRKRIKIAKEQERVDLKEEIQKNYKGVKFDTDPENGLEFIANYDAILQKYYNKYLNATTQEAQDKAKKKYDDFKDLLDRFEKVNETIDNDVAEIRSLIDEKYQNFIAQFEYELTMRINWGETDRDVREFFKNFKGEISDIDFLGLANFEKSQLESFKNSGELTSKTRQIYDIMGEIDKIDKANADGKKITNKEDEKYFSAVYGDDKAKAMEDLRKIREGLMGDLESMKEARDNAYDAYLDAIDDGIEKFDKHIEQYEMVNEELEHNKNLIEMIYGESSDMMKAQYDLQEQNNLGQIKSLKTIRDTYKERADKEREAMAAMEEAGDTTSQAYADAKERAEMYEEAYIEANGNLQKATENAVQNLIDKYTFGVKKTLDNMANSLFASGTNPTFNTALTEWDLMEKESEMYLDNINAAFEIQKLESKYRDALNSTDSITAQKKLNEAMESELGMLREKDKLSQYEIDRANLQYELTLKQIALEEAQQNKSKMRLRRDAQGNYSYQFTADTDNINKAQQDVNDVLQQLTNLSQEKGKEIYETALNETQNFIERMAEIEAMADGAEKDRLRTLTQENYDRVMGDLMSQSELVEKHIGDLVNGPLAEIISEEKKLFEGDQGISTQVINLTKTLRENIAGKGGISEITKAALKEIDDKAEEYRQGLKAIGDATGQAFDKLSDETYVANIKTKIESLTTETGSLKTAWEGTLTAIEGVLTAMDEILETSPEVEAALEAITAAEDREKTEYKAAGDEAENANKELVEAKEDPTPTTTVTETNEDKDKNKKKTKKKTIKVGGKVKAKGNILNYDGSSAGKQYFSSDPKYKVLKINGNLVQVRWHKLPSGVTGYFKKSQLTPLRSGGYTGDWNGDGGKVALLHKKELVLNQKDTQNILDAVNIIRGLSGLLQNSMINRIEGLTQSLNGLSLPTVQTNSETGPQAIEQTVHITAEFPGATEALQIETALNNLVNRASQYAFRKE